MPAQRSLRFLQVAGIPLAALIGFLAWQLGSGLALPEATDGDAPQQATTTPGPSATPDELPLELTWREAVSGDARFVEVDPQGRAWLRISDPGGGPDTVAVASARRPAEVWPTLHAAVEARYEELLRSDTLRDFFAVDINARRVWVGPRYYADGAWTSVVTESPGAGGGSYHEDRVVLDDAGRAGIPWHAVVDCPTPGGCVEDGVDRFAFDGELEGGLRFDPAPGAARDELPACHLVSAEGAAWIVARRALFRLDDLNVPIEYPPLVGAGGTPNAGYATAALRAADGSVLVFVWAERRDRPTLVHELTALAWDGTTWTIVLAADVLGAAPFFNGDSAFERVTAATFDTVGRLWIAGSTGGLGVWSFEESDWVASWLPVDLGIPDDARIRDVAVGSDGAVWLATSAGARLGARPIAGMNYLPRVEVAR